MKVAYVCSSLSYPASSGMHQQTLVNIHNLQDAGHRVDVFAFKLVADPLDQLALEQDMGIRLASPPISYRGRVLLYAFRNLALPASKDLVHELRQGHFDVIHLEGCIAACLAPRLNGEALLIDLIDAWSLRQARAGLMTSGLRSAIHKIAEMAYKLLEQTLDRLECLWHVVSAEDAEYLRMRYRSRVSVIPVTAPEGIKRIRSRDRNPHILIFADLRQRLMMASLGKIVNEGLARDPTLRGLDYTVLGRVEDTPELRAAMGPLIYQNLRWVEDYAEIMAKHEIVLLPDRFGTGLKNRTVQCLTVGAAVVGTDVAFEGIPAVNGIHAVISSTPTGLAKGLTRLVEDEAGRKALGAKASDLAVSLYSASRILAMWESLYCEVVQNSRATR